MPTIVYDARWATEIAGPRTIDLPASTDPFVLLPLSGVDLYEVTARGTFDVLIASGATDPAIQTAAAAAHAAGQYLRYPASTGPIYTRGHGPTAKLCIRSAGAAVALGLSVVPIRTP